MISREEAVDYPPEDEQAKEAKPTSDLPWAERASAQAAEPTVDLETGEVLDEGTSDKDLQAALVASLAVAQEECRPRVGCRCESPQILGRCV